MPFVAVPTAVALAAAVAPFPFAFAVCASRLFFPFAFPFAFALPWRAIYGTRMSPANRLKRINLIRAQVSATYATSGH